LVERAGIGPLIGKRTWGGFAGIDGYPQLIYGRLMTAPHFAFGTLPQDGFKKGLRSTPASCAST